MSSPTAKEKRSGTREQTRLSPVLLVRRGCENPRFLVSPGTPPLVVSHPQTVRGTTEQKQKACLSSALELTGW